MWSFRVLHAPLSSHVNPRTAKFQDGIIEYDPEIRKAILRDALDHKQLDWLQPVNAGQLVPDCIFELEHSLIKVVSGPIVNGAPVQEENKSNVAVLKNQTEATASSIFAIIYTKDKVKKSKAWIDGYSVFDHSGDLV